MMNKIKNFMNTPITWGASFKASAICMLISMVVSLPFYFSLWGISLDDIKEKFSFKK